VAVVHLAALRLALRLAHPLFHQVFHRLPQPLNQLESFTLFLLMLRKILIILLPLKEQFLTCEVGGGMRSAHIRHFG
jgi:hypothetical protein